MIKDDSNTFSSTVIRLCVSDAGRIVFMLVRSWGEVVSSSGLKKRNAVRGSLSSKWDLCLESEEMGSRVREGEREKCPAQSGNNTFFIFRLILYTSRT